VTQVLEHPTAAPTETVTPAAPTETVTPAAPAPPAPATAAADKPRARRGRGAAGTSVFPHDTLEAAQADAKAKGKKFNVFRVTSPAALNKPERFYTSNHRNAVQYSVMVADGYSITSGNGERGGQFVSRDPEKAAEKSLDMMNEKSRLALFARYMKANPEFAKQLEGAVAPRDDTTPDFNATANGAPVVAASAPAASVAAPTAAPAPAPAVRAAGAPAGAAAPAPAPASAPTKATPKPNTVAAGPVKRK
jgi:hypothetical protein